MTDQFDKKAEFQRGLEKLNSEMNRLFERYDCLPGNTHARHIAGNIAGAARNSLEAARTSKDQSHLASALESLEVLTLWFELLDTHSEFRERELASVEPSLAGWNFEGGAAEYVRFAAETLRKSVK